MTSTDLHLGSDIDPVALATQLRMLADGIETGEVTVQSVVSDSDIDGEDMPDFVMSVGYDTSSEAFLPGLLLHDDAGEVDR